MHAYVNNTLYIDDEKNKHEERSLLVVGNGDRVSIGQLGVPEVLEARPIHGRWLGACHRSGMRARGGGHQMAEDALDTMHSASERESRLGWDCALGRSAPGKLFLLSPSRLESLSIVENHVVWRYKE